MFFFGMGGIGLAFGHLARLMARDLLAERRFRQVAVGVRGEVLEREDLPGPGTAGKGQVRRAALRVSFRASDGCERVARVVVNDPSAVPGTRVSLEYDPARPSEARLERGPGAGGAHTLGWTLVFGACSIGCFLILLSAVIA
ncbi:hypothetical protein GCM10022221_49370 [Actinocorallia aurea]